MRTLKNHLTFANIMSCMALFIALGGVSYAATQLPQNSITSKQIKKGSIQLSDLSKGARSALVAPGPKGPAGQPGAAGGTGQAGPGGPAGPQTSILASGQTLRGSFNLDFEAASAGDGLGGDISFGLNLPQPPQTHVVAPDEKTPDCPGSVQDPQAARGHFCVYETTEANVNSFAVCDSECESEDPAAETWGSELYLFAKAAGRSFVSGSWAVTAP